MTSEEPHARSRSSLRAFLLRRAPLTARPQGRSCPSAWRTRTGCAKLVLNKDCAQCQTGRLSGWAPVPFKHQGFRTSARWSASEPRQASKLFISEAAATTQHLNFRDPGPPITGQICRLSARPIRPRCPVQTRSAAPGRAWGCLPGAQASLRAFLFSRAATIPRPDFGAHEPPRTVQPQGCSSPRVLL